MAEKLNWTAAEAAAATKGKLIYGPADGTFSGVSIDSRSIAQGDLFIAICGPNHDGHDHAAESVAQGQRGVLINQATKIALPHDQWRQKGYICIAVEDTIRALGDMAAYNRKRAGFPVVAITGSNGKTSTRRMTLSVMQQIISFPVPVLWFRPMGIF
jgi:UDP-N-acetylmuramoyl-tripeptide--D-alanyl-D-alanine ligase